MALYYGMVVGGQLAKAKCGHVEACWAGGVWVLVLVLVWSSRRGQQPPLAVFISQKLSTLCDLS